MIYVQNLLGYLVKYLVEVFIMYSVFQAAGYILTAVALAQVPLWALYEIYKTPAKGFTNVSVLKILINVSYIELYSLENHECFPAQR